MTSPELTVPNPIQNTGRYLSSEEIQRLQIYLTIYLSLPFGLNLPGEVAEQIIALARDGVYVGKRANRPEPDMVLRGLNYSIKTEKVTNMRVHAQDRLGTIEDIITARLPIGDIGDGIPAQLGTIVLESFNRDVAAKYSWNKMAILLRFQHNSEFIYFEEEVVPYDPSGYRWEWTGRGRGNIAAYDSEGKQRFRWNFGTTLLYVVHDIPTDSDVFTVEKKTLTIDFLAQAIANLTV